MRTITEIKDSITADFMRSEAAASAYGFTAGDNFSAHFSQVSIESLLFYVFAAAAWVMEGLFDQHRREVETRMDELLPHRPKWYRDKVLGFMKDKELVEGTDRYDTTGMSDDAIEKAHVVKYVSATENANASMLTLKVAGETDGIRCPLPKDVEHNLALYINEVKDAGVRINLVNIEPIDFHCTVDVYCQSLENMEGRCRDAIKKYIENLPFNGEYTNMGLVDILQLVEGVKVVGALKAWTISPEGKKPISARCSPDAGYFVAGDILVTIYEYE